jgi:hypothetical protein
MIEVASLTGRMASAIGLATKKGTPVPNEFAPPAGASDVAEFDYLRGNHPGWVERKRPIGGYNCAGLVWATRRVALYDQVNYNLIIIEDGYSRIPVTEVRPGDIAIYCWVGTAKLSHVADVVEVRSVPGSTIIYPWVLSKFGNGGGEAVHRFDDWPGMVHLQISFWTDR